MMIRRRYVMCYLIAKNIDEEEFVNVVEHM